MKKIAGLIAMFLLVLSVLPCFAGCGGGDEVLGVDETHAYPERLRLTIMAREFQNDNGELSADSDTVLQYFEDKFNVEFEIINIVSPRQEDLYERQNMLISTGDLPDIMPGRTDFRVSYDIYNSLVKRGLVVNFSEYVGQNKDRYPVLYDLSQSEICTQSHSYLTEDGICAMIPRYFGAIDHGFIIRKDWLDELGMSVPQTWQDLKEVLIAFNRADLGGVPHIGLTMPNTWWFNHIIAGFTGAGTFMVAEDPVSHAKEYTYTLGTQGQIDGYNYLKDLYSWRDRTADPDNKGLLDADVFTSQHERDTIAKFNAQQTGVALIGLTYAVPRILPELQAADPDAELCYVNIQGPVAPMRLRMEEYFEGVLISSRFKDTARLFDMVEFILSDEGQTIMRYGLEGVHYTLDENGNKVINEQKRREEGWFGKVHCLSSLFDCSPTIDSDFSSDYEKINDFIEMIRRPESTVRQELLGIVLESEKTNSRHWDLIGTKSANYIRGAENVDWAATYQEFLSLGGQEALDEVNSKYKIE